MVDWERRVGASRGGLSDRARESGEGLVRTLNLTPLPTSLATEYGAVATGD